MLYYKTWSKFNHACQRKAEHLLTMRVGGYGALAQLVARDIRIVEARGSNPLCSTQKSEPVIGSDFSLFSPLYPYHPNQLFLVGDGFG